MGFPDVKRFWETDIWRVHRPDIHPAKGLFIRMARIAVITAKSFQKDRCAQIATSLTFYTLLSITPVLALAFGIAKGFGFEKVLERELKENFGHYAELLHTFFEFAQSLLESARGGVVAGVGAAILIWSVVRLLNQIETALNQIWGVTVHRHPGRRFVDYLAVMLIGPLLMVIYSSTMVYIAARVDQQTGLLGMFGPVVFILIRIAPFAMICGLLALIYVMMPNTRVRVSAALAAGIVAGTLLHVVQHLLIALQVDVSRYNAIYGGFSAIPVFLLWLQAGWLIVLLGAELSYAIENNDHFELHPDFYRISTFMKRSLAIAMVQIIVRRFINGRPPLSAGQIASELNISRRLAETVLEDMIACGILAPVENKKNGASRFLAARDPADLHAVDILKALDHQGIDHIQSMIPENLQSISDLLKRLENEMEKLPDNRPLKEL